MKTVHSKKIRTAHFIPTLRHPDNARFIRRRPRPHHFPECQLLSYALPVKKTLGTFGKTVSTLEKTVSISVFTEVLSVFLPLSPVVNLSVVY